MELFTSNVLLDILIFCFLSIAIAIPLYSYFLKSSPNQGGCLSGNVPTSTYTEIDILGIFLASLLFSFNIVYMAMNPEPIDLDSAQEISNSAKLANGLIGQLIPVAITCGFLAPRMNIAEVFGLKKPNTGKIFLTSFAGLICIYIAIASSMLIIAPFLKNALGEQELQAPVQMIIDAKKNNPALLVILAFLAVIVAPICEEFVFRGYIYATLKRFSCRVFATISSALFFAVVHGNLWSLFPLFIVAIGLTIIYEISGSLWAPILTHMLFNGITTFFLIFGNAPDL